MAKVVYLDPIARLDGKISRKHSRVIYNYRKDTGAMYTSMQGERSTPVKPEEIAQRTKFRVVSQAVRLRLADTTKTAADAAAFKAQSTYPTFRGFMFARAWSLYDDTSSTVIWDT